jgi:hypothetical protein
VALTNGTGVRVTEKRRRQELRETHQRIVLANGC